MLKTMRVSKETRTAEAEIKKLYRQGKVFAGLRVKRSAVLSAATKQFDRHLAQGLCAKFGKKRSRGVWGFYLHNMKRIIVVGLGNGYCGVGVHDYGAGRSYIIGVAKCGNVRGGEV